MENTTKLPTMDELDLPPTVEDLSKAIDSLSCGKTLGIGCEGRKRERPPLTSP
jgi:hypothetical protein